MIRKPQAGLSKLPAPFPRGHASRSIQSQDPRKRTHHTNYANQLEVKLDMNRRGGVEAGVRVFVVAMKKYLV